MSKKKKAERPLSDLENLAQTPPGRPDQISTQDFPEVLPIMPMVELNLFPRMIFPLLVMDKKLMAVVQDSMVKDRMVGLFALKGDIPQSGEITSEILYEIGVAAQVVKMSTAEDGGMRVLAQGLHRIRLEELVSDDPYLMARVRIVEDELEMDQEVQALMANVRGMFKRVLDLSPNMPDELAVINQNVDNPGLLADMIASAISMPREERQVLLSTLNVKDRLNRIMQLLQKHLDILELGSKIQTQIKDKMDKTQRDYYLREQMKAIRDELGEKDEASVELDDLTARLFEKPLSVEAREAAEKELERLRKMSPSSAEYTVSRTYLDWILDLPWQEYTEDRIDIKKAQEILDKDHFGLEKIKKRIIEYLAVRRLKPDIKGPILCFAGPPGTGKTSLGQSIARCLGRKFIRISLGGVRDEAEIRGHRRTYVGALPGRIIQGLKKVGTSNPVFMMDEIDKLGSDFRGDPSSALLEVLDPEQNFSFSDHYLEVAYDLSNVMFIGTANVLDSIPGPLRDRLEIITLAGYTTEEKIQIGKRYLIPRQREGHGLMAKNIVIRDAALKRMITDYTREAGVRNLERQIGSVCRHVATKVAGGEKEKVVVTADLLAEILGPPRFESEVRIRTAPAGVATGMAWTQAGGDILFIEATAMPGTGRLTLTGQLGDVMKESAQAALSYIRSKWKKLGIDSDFFAKNDLHVHVPAGAIPKDGPSAGVTIASALASLVTGRRVRSDLSMTGEITLRGLVLPVGGIKEKVLAAKRAGIKQIIIPKRNEKDLSEIAEGLLKGLEVHTAETIDQVWEIALK